MTHRKNWRIRPTNTVNSRERDWATQMEWPEERESGGKPGCDVGSAVGWMQGASLRERGQGATAEVVALAAGARGEARVAQAAVRRGGAGEPERAVSVGTRRGGTRAGRRAAARDGEAELRREEPATGAGGDGGGLKHASLFGENPGMHRAARHAAQLYKLSRKTCGAALTGWRRWCVRSLGEEPQRGALFVFVGKRAPRVKVLWWERTGYCHLAPLVLPPECLQNGRGLQVTGRTGGNCPVDSKCPDSLTIQRKACAFAGLGHPSSPGSNPVGDASIPPAPLPLPKSPHPCVEDVAATLLSEPP